MLIKYKSGQPCSHTGCRAHLSHPCEECGRIAAQGNVYKNIFEINETEFQEWLDSLPKREEMEGEDDKRNNIQ